MKGDEDVVDKIVLHIVKHQQGGHANIYIILLSLYNNK
jgi:hypothetical protein